MAEYIDREKIFPNGVFYVSAENPESSLTELINRICNLPTADVVPKSEVESILDGLMKEAREIANRYEKSANETSDYDYARIEYRGCQMGALLVLFKIAELKKKYTEDIE